METSGLMLSQKLYWQNQCKQNCKSCRTGQRWWYRPRLVNVQWQLVYNLSVVRSQYYFIKLLTYSILCQCHMHYNSYLTSNTKVLSVGKPLIRAEVVHGTEYIVCLERKRGLSDRPIYSGCLLIGTSNVILMQVLTLRFTSPDGQVVEAPFRHVCYE